METRNLIGNYFLLEEEFKTFIGSSYRAVNVLSPGEHKEHVNLFILNPELCKEKKIIKVLKDRWDEIIKIKNPRFLGLKSVEIEDEAFLFVKEYIPGIRISRIIYEENSLQFDINGFLYIFKEICSALISIQSHLSDIGNSFVGLINPNNTVLTGNGEIKLDNYFFGKVLSASKINKDDFSDFYGQNLPSDENGNLLFSLQSDLIQLGWFFFEMLTGRKIAAGLTLDEVEVLIENAEIRDAFSQMVPMGDDLKQYIRKAVHISSEGNFTSMEELSNSFNVDILETGKYLPASKEFIMLAGDMKSEIAALHENLEKEAAKDYTTEIAEKEEKGKIQLDKRAVQSESGLEEEKWDKDYDLGIKVAGDNLLKKATSALKKLIGNGIKWIKNHPFQLAGGAGGIAAIIVAFMLFAPQGQEVASPPPLLKGSVSLVTSEGIDYSDVSAEIKDLSLAFESSKAQEIQAGIHNIKFQKGDRNFIKEIEIKEGENLKVPVPLHALNIKIEPQGEVWKEGELLRENNKNHVFYLLPGKYVFTFKAEGYKDEIREITITENEQQGPIDIQLIPLPSKPTPKPKKPGILRAQVFPSSKVYEGERLIASFPPFKQDIRLSAGKHTLRFTTSQQGCKTVTETFNINSGEIKEYTLHLCYGYLNINSIPLGARIIIDGKESDLDGKSYGQTPKANLKLPAGPHTVTIQHPQYPPKTIQFVVQANEMIKKSIDLTKDK